MKFLNKFSIIVFCILCFTLNIFGQSGIPDQPKFISASVVPDSDPVLIELNWLESDSSNVIGYIIYRVNEENITNTLDTVDGRTTTHYEYQYPYAIYSPEKFRIASFSEENASSITDPHTTMLLDYEYEKCNIEITLKWTKYIGWEENTLYYRIYRRTESTEYEEIATVESDSLQYIDNDVSGSIQYYYYVEAVSASNYTSASNSINLFTDAYSRPSRLLIDYVTVEDDQIKVKFLVDESTDVDKYLIQRADELNREFVTLEEVSNTRQLTILYTDRKVEVNNTIYFYRILSVDPCGNNSAESNVSSNILLKAGDNNIFINNLSWTPYQTWTSGVSEYNVYNTFDLNRLFLGSIDAISLEYEHNIGSYVEESHKNKIYVENRMCYYVEAIENGYDDYENVNASRSNVACINKKSLVYVPTAFNPVSHTVENREFKPLLTFYEENSYEFLIFDRWGNTFFRTNDVYEGWNGYLREKLAPSQRYQYLIRYKDFNGDKFEKSGSFFLIAK